MSYAALLLFTTPLAYIGTLIAETIVTALEPLGIHLDIFL